MASATAIPKQSGHTNNQAPPQMGPSPSPRDRFGRPYQRVINDEPPDYVPFGHKIAALSEAQRQEFMSSLSEKELKAFYYDYSNWARFKQLPPSWDWFIWIIISGRGFGKTWSGANWCHEQVRQGVKRLALIGRTAADVRDTMIQ